MQGYYRDWLFLAFLFLASILILLFPTTAAQAASCSCFDPGTNAAVGPIFPLPAGGDCNATCSQACRSQSPDLRCFLCQPEGGLDCSAVGGGGGGGGSGGGSSGLSIYQILFNLTFGFNFIIVLLVLIATALLLLGITRYIAAGDDEDEVKTARRLIMYGVIGLGMMIVVWAFVGIVIDFFFRSGTNISVPGVDIVKPL